MKYFSQLLIFTFFFGCVSVNLPKQTGHKAEQVDLHVPAKPFSEMNSQNADRAWISDKTGNTISYLSDCDNPSDPTLQQLESETLGVLNEMKVLFTQNINFNSREAIDTLAEGLVDGVAVRMKLITFKKNNCSYSLVYGGLKEKFDAEIKYFNDFIKGFKAP
jgi:hypothetical protein